MDGVRIIGGCGSSFRDEEAPPARYMVQHLGEAHALAAAPLSCPRRRQGPVRPSWSLDLPDANNAGHLPGDLGPRSSLRENSVEGAVFAFEALCGSERGAGDFHAIARAYPSIAIADVPPFSLKEHDKARRFITLVDECYERRNLLVVVARRGPDALFPSEDVFERQLTSEKTQGVDRASGPVSTIDPADDEASAALDLVSVRELAWAFKRCASRLAEMAAPDWPQKLTEVSASA